MRVGATCPCPCPHLARARRPADGGLEGRAALGGKRGWSGWGEALPPSDAKGEAPALSTLPTLPAGVCCLDILDMSGVGRYSRLRASRGRGGRGQGAGSSEPGGRYAPCSPHPMQPVRNSGLLQGTLSPQRHPPYSTHYLLCWLLTGLWTSGRLGLRGPVGRFEGGQKLCSLPDPPRRPHRPWCLTNSPEQCKYLADQSSGCSWPGLQATSIDLDLRTARTCLSCSTSPHSSSAKPSPCCLPGGGLLPRDRSGLLGLN